MTCINPKFEIQDDYLEQKAAQSGFFIRATLFVAVLAGALGTLLTPYLQASRDLSRVGGGSSVATAIP